MSARAPQLHARSSAAALLSAWLLGSCVPADPAQDAHAHDPAAEEPLAVVTAWEAGYEIFYEYPAPVVDEPFEIPFHVTRLSDGAPRASGPVRLIWRDANGSERVHQLDETRRAGLYLPEVVFRHPGTTGFAVEIPAADGDVRIELPELVVHADPHAAEHAELPSSPDGITFLKEQQWLLGLRTELVARRSLEQRVVVPGTVTAVPARHGVVSPPLAGRLEPPPDGALPALGARIEQGELVGYVRPPWSELTLRVQEARTELRAAQVDLARVERASQRVEELHERQARSDRELEEARFEVDAARARLESARATVAAVDALQERVGDGGDGSLLPRFELRAPVSGVVQEVGAALGEAIEPGCEVLHLLDTTRVQIVAHPSPEQLAQIDPELLPRCTRHGSSSEAEEVAIEDAHLVLVAGAITEPGHTVPVIYEVANPDGALLTGALLEVGLSTGIARDVLSIPASALVDDAGQPTAYVQTSGETFARRDLEIGARSDGFVEVVRGLEEGERVVVERAYAIRLASASGSVPVHSH